MKTNNTTTIRIEPRENPGVSASASLVTESRASTLHVSPSMGHDWSMESIMEMDKISVQDEIQELNLTYLLLVQRMLNEDRATAMFRFKINGAMADLLQSLSAKQLAQLARSNQVLFGLHFSNAGQLARATSN